jgi:hypothetical protein
MATLNAEDAPAPNVTADRHTDEAQQILRARACDESATRPCPCVGRLAIYLQRGHHVLYSNSVRPIKAGGSAADQTSVAGGPWSYRLRR